MKKGRFLPRLWWSPDSLFWFNPALLHYLLSGRYRVIFLQLQVRNCSNLLFAIQIIVQPVSPIVHIASFLWLHRFQCRCKPLPEPAVGTLFTYWKSSRYHLQRILSFGSSRQQPVTIAFLHEWFYIYPLVAGLSAWWRHIFSGQHQQRQKHRAVEGFGVALHLVS